MIAGIIHIVIFVASIGYVTWRALDELIAGVPFLRVVWTLAWQSLVIVLLIATSALLSVVGVNILLGGISVIVLAMVINRRARIRRDSLLTLLAMAGERGMPLEPILYAYAGECGGAFGRRLERLADRLRTGAPLTQLLAAWPRLVPQQAICAAQLGTQTGQLGKALRGAVAVTQARAMVWNRLMSAGWLIFWPLAVLGVMFALSANFIYPKIVMITQDFGLPLPPSTQWAAAIGANPLFNVAVGMGLLGLLLLLFYAVLAYIGWVPFVFPYIDRLFVRFQSTYVLRHLALVCDAGQPMSSGLQMLAQSYPTAWVRARLQRASQRVQTGENWTDALAATRIVDAGDLALLRAAERVGNLGWALRLAADTGERRQTYRILALCEILLPVLIVVTGILVLFMAANLFVPLADLIEAQTE